MNTTLAGLIGTGFFYGVIFLTGVYAHRRQSADRSTDGLLLAGRQMPAGLGIFTMIATWVGGGFINGTAEAVFDEGAGLVWAQAPWGYALSLVLGGLFFARKIRGHGFTTLIDLFDRNYGKRTAAVLFVPALVGEVFWSAAILAALGITFSVILNIDLTTAILVSSAIAIAYTMLGGLWAVAYTDVVQLVLILLGLGVALPFAIGRAGGWDAVTVAYAERFADVSLFPPLAAWAGGGGWGDYAWLWLDYALLLIFGGIPWQVYFQRVLACRTDRAAVQLSVFAGFGCLLLALPPMVLGATGTAIDWSVIGSGEPPEAHMILPYMLLHLTPPLVAAAGLGAIAAAVMSSVDSSILSASSMLAWNVYRPLLRPEADDRELRRTVRLAVLGVGLAATAMALTVQSVYALWALCSDLVYVILFPQLVMGLYYRGVTREGALAGAGVALLLRLGGGEPLFGLPALLPYPMQTPDGVVLFPFRTTAMLAALLTIYVVSRLTYTASKP